MGRDSNQSKTKPQELCVTIHTILVVGLTGVRLCAGETYVYLPKGLYSPRGYPDRPRGHNFAVLNVEADGPTKLLWKGRATFLSGL